MSKINPKDKLFSKGKANPTATKRGRGRPRNDIEMTRYTYYLPKDLVEKIADEAYWRNVSTNVIIVEACQKYFGARKVKPRPTEKTVRDIMSAE